MTFEETDKQRDALILRQKVARWLYLVCGLILGLGFGYVLGHERQVAENPVLYPLIEHTISVGRSAKVVYLERWTKDSDMTSCTDYEIIWPAGASQGHIDYMIENARGQRRHKFRRVGWWRKDIQNIEIIKEE